MIFFNGTPPVDTCRHFTRIALFFILLTLQCNSLRSQTETCKNSAHVSDSFSMNREFKEKIRSYIREGKYEEILHEMPDLTKRVGELSEGDYVIYFGGKIGSYIMLDEQEKAYDFIYAVSHIKKDDPYTLLLRGMLDCDNNNYGMAIKSFTRYIEVAEESDQLQGHLNRAVVFAIIGDKLRLAQDIASLENHMNQMKKRFEDPFEANASIVTVTSEDELSCMLKVIKDMMKPLEDYLNDESGKVLVVKSQNIQVVDIMKSGKIKKGIGLTGKLVTIQ